MGSSTALTRFEINRIARSGRAPIDIMLKNMWWWDEQADVIGEQISAAVAELPTVKDEAKRNEELGKLRKQLDAFTHARSQSQSCAVDAAPYCHAKLQTVALKKDNKGAVIEVETVVQSGAIGNAVKESDEGKAAKPAEPDRSYRNGYNSTSVVPIRRAG